MNLKQKLKQTIVGTLAAITFSIFGTIASAVDLKPLDRPAIDTYPDDRLLTEEPLSERDCGIVLTSRQDYPRLMLNTGGPTAAVRALSFSPDSTRIYAGGLDKTVHVWGVRTAARAIQRTTVNTAVLVQTLHWEITRGPRGAIYTLAANPTNRELALAGYSARDATGDIVIYDTARQEVVRALQGHRQAVTHLSYSPDGKRLASITRDGEVMVWSQDSNWQSTVLRASGPVSTQFQPLCFLDDNTLAVATAADDQGNNWQISLFNLAQADAEVRVLPQLHSQRITTIVADLRSDHWASADWQGNVFVWDGTNDDEPSLLRKDRLALSLSFAPGPVLFVATALQERETQAGKVSQSVLEMWDVQTGELVDQVQTSRAEHNFVCGVSPDGSRVVTYAGDKNQLLVFLLKDRTGPIDKPLSQRPLRLGGTGNKRVNVAFEEGTYRIGFSSDPQTPVQTIFDLSDPQVVAGAPDQITWRNRNSNANGWELRVVGGNASQLKLFQNGTERGSITLDPNVYGNVRTYCWLAKDGQTYGIALGTDVQNGIFVFGTAQTGPCPLLRYYRDHSDVITSLCSSTDGKYLASCSNDQTVKVWSLENLTVPAETFAQAAGWGAEFKLDNGKVVVDDVLPAGTAARKGIRNGDVIVEAKFGPVVARKLGMGDEEFTTNDPQVIFDALSQCPLTENVLLTLDRLGMRLNQKVLLIPAWEPLMTLFVNEQKEWALWTPQGYFDASVNGDELFGWLLNKGVTNKPEFYRADQFRFELERPEVLKKLLSLGSVPAALRESKQPIPEDPNRVVDDGIRNKPVVRILSPFDGSEVASQAVRVRAVVEFPTTDAAETIQGNAFVNGVPGRVVDSQQAGLQKTYEWDVPLSDIYNRLRVVAEDTAPDRMVSFSDVHFRLDPTKLGTENPKLHLITLAATDYQNVAKLECSIRDAMAITEELRSRSQKFYEPGQLVSLHNEKANRENLLKAVEQLKEELRETRPDDLLVLFLAGHGIAVDGEYYFVPIDAKRENLKQVGIAWSDIRQLAAIPCRKLVLMDTCHSGSVLPLREVGSSNWKAAIRPLKLDEFLVLSATDVGQEALEFGDHGIFTQCILEALQGRATSGTEVVYLQDVVDYVETQVPQRTAKLQLQTPKSSPAELFNVISVPLAAVGN